MRRELFRSCSRFLPPLLAAATMSACAKSRMQPEKPASPLAVLPLISVDGMPFISVRTDSAPAHLWLIDSGFQVSVVNARFATLLHVQTQGRRKVAAPGGQIDVGRVPGIPLHLQNITYTPDSLEVIDLHHVEPLLGLAYAGILGHDFLTRYVTRIDYDNQRVELFEPSTFVYAGPGKSLQVWIEAAQSFVLGILYSHGYATPAKLKMDTGSLDALGLNGSFVEQSELVHGIERPLPATGAAIGGKVEAYVVRLDSIALSGTIIPKPIAGYSAETKRRGDAGTIGVALLSRFNLVFDYRRNRVIIETTVLSDRPMRYDGSGLFLTGTGPDYSEIAVVSVESESSAAAAGIQPGDLILQIDGTPVAQVGLSGTRSRLTMPGVVSLRIAHSGRARDVVLRLVERL